MTAIRFEFAKDDVQDTAINALQTCTDLRGIASIFTSQLYITHDDVGCI